MDIRISQLVKNYVGPSQNYYIAQNRFDTILKEKLRVTDDNIVDANLIFEESEESNLKDYDNSSVIGDSNTPIFSNESQIVRDQFSAVRPLTKTISSLAINGVIDTSDVRKKSNYTAEYLNKKLEGTPLAGHGEDFKRAEDLYGVNAILLMSIAKLESNYGRSKIAMDKNNLFGFMAYDNSPYSSAKSYETKADSIYDAAKHLSKNYLTQGAPYFNGYSVDDIGKSYSTSSGWAREVKKISSEIIQ